MPINTGSLNLRVRISQRAAGTDALGQAAETWQTLADVWAGAQPPQGREFFNAGAQFSANTVVWRIRYRADVTTRMRLTDLRTNGKVFDIEAVLPDAQREFIDLVCTSDVGDAL